MKYRILFRLTEKWMDQHPGRRYDINEAHKNFEQWSLLYLHNYPLDRWMMAEETTDLTTLPIPASLEQKK